MENINDMIKHALLDDKDSFYNLCKKEIVVYLIVGN